MKHLCTWYKVDYSTFYILILTFENLSLYLKSLFKYQVLGPIVDELVPSFPIRIRTRKLNRW
jgi:hypothetical protein